jgi:hypothetical protein
MPQSSPSTLPQALTMTKAPDILQQVYYARMYADPEARQRAGHGRRIVPVFVPTITKEVGQGSAEHCWLAKSTCKEEEGKGVWAGCKRVSGRVGSRSSTHRAQLPSLHAARLKASWCMRRLEARAATALPTFYASEASKKDVATESLRENGRQKGLAEEVPTSWYFACERHVKVPL